MGGVIDVVGARVTADGKVPMLETRHRFYYTEQVDQAYATTEAVTNPMNPFESIVMEVEPEEIKLLAVLLDSNASRLAPSYVAVQQETWGTGSHLTPSFLLPIEPLTQEVTLRRPCHVCGAENARDCGACRLVAYCSKDCQTKDWKEHKLVCKAAKAAQAGSSSASQSVVLDLRQSQAPGRFVSNVSMTASSSNSLKGGVTAGEAFTSPAEGQEVRMAGRRFVLMVQAPMVGPQGPPQPLYVYDASRKVTAFISAQQQPAYDQLVALVRAQGYSQAKLYCWAAFEPTQELRVFLDDLPTQVHSW